MMMSRWFCLPLSLCASSFGQGIVTTVAGTEIDANGVINTVAGGGRQLVQRWKAGDAGLF
ncbi:MAG TPA: hypothetical protein VNY05_33575 [Candidatus Acidoferrales bacterium]|jgi:hypothetical protein|nr:hypothetical protein [Candidatus Acidoferrales bacterium]